MTFTQVVQSHQPVCELCQKVHEASGQRPPAVRPAPARKGRTRAGEERARDDRSLAQSLKKASGKVFGPGQWKVKLITFVGGTGVFNKSSRF